MRTFDEIFEISTKRKGGVKALEALLSKPASAKDLAKIPDDRWLSMMAKRIFQAGFSWKVIENKWLGFEPAFEGFVPARVAMYGDIELDRLLADKGIVRNPQKINAVIANAAFLKELADEHGSAAKFFAAWPDDDMIGLLEVLKKRGARLGGATGQYLLRYMGKDAFILSPDVTARLIAEGIVDKQPTSKRDLRAAQEAFNIWHEQSGRSYTEISQVLAMSVGA